MSGLLERYKARGIHIELSRNGLLSVTFDDQSLATPELREELIRNKPYLLRELGTTVPREETWYSSIVSIPSQKNPGKIDEWVLVRSADGQVVQWWYSGSRKAANEKRVHVAQPVSA